MARKKRRNRETFGINLGPLMSNCLLKCLNTVNHISKRRPCKLAFLMSFLRNKIVTYIVKIYHNFSRHFSSHSQLIAISQNQSNTNSPPSVKTSTPAAPLLDQSNTNKAASVKTSLPAASLLDRSKTNNPAFVKTSTPAAPLLDQSNTKIPASQEQHSRGTQWDNKRLSTSCG